MRYRIELKPQGVIPRDFGLTIPLSGKGPASAKTATTASLTGCGDTRVDSWLVLQKLATGDTDLAPLQVIVSPDPRNAGEFITVPFPNNCVTDCFIYTGLACLADDDCLEWAAVGDDTDWTFQFSAGEADDDPCKSTQFLATLADGADYTGRFCTVQASLNGESIGPPIKFVCAPTLYQPQFYSWCTSYRQSDLQLLCNGSNDLTGCGDLTYEVTTDCVIYVILRGFQWYGSYNSNWEWTQISGSPLDITITPVGCGGMFVSFDGVSDYTGTSYLLTASVNGQPFGDSITITCEA